MVGNDKFAFITVALAIVLLAITSVFYILQIDSPFLKYSKWIFLVSGLFIINFVVKMLKNTKDE